MSQSLSGVGGRLTQVHVLPHPKVSISVLMIQSRNAWLSMVLTSFPDGWAQRASIRGRRWVEGRPDQVLGRVTHPLVGFPTLRCRLQREPTDLVSSSVPLKQTMPRSWTGASTSTSRAAVRDICFSMASTKPGRFASRTRNCSRRSWLACAGSRGSILEVRIQPCSAARSPRTSRSAEATSSSWALLVVADTRAHPDSRTSTWSDLPAAG